MGGGTVWLVRGVDTRCPPPAGTGGGPYNNINII